MVMIDTWNDVQYGKLRELVIMPVVLLNNMLTITICSAQASLPSGSFFFHI